MRLRLTTNAAGEIRVVSLPDARKPPKAVAANCLLVSTCEFQDGQEKPPSAKKVGYGLVSSGTTFGKRAKSTVREVGAVLDELPLDRVVFLTGTLPGGTVAAVESIAAYSGWCVATLKQWFRDQFPAALTVGVWEYQERGALHMHLCVGLPTNIEAKRLIAAWQERWIALIDGIGERADVDMYERLDGGSWRNSKGVTQTDAQFVRKSVRCYLAKYLSKSADKIKSNAVFPPSRWWFCDRQLLREARFRRLSVEVQLLSLFDVRTLLVKAGSLMFERCQATFAYESPMDTRIRGYVGFAEPVAARGLYQYICAVLRCLSPELGSLNRVTVPPLAVAAAMFGGTVWDGEMPSIPRGH